MTKAKSSKECWSCDKMVKWSIGLTNFMKTFYEIGKAGSQGSRKQDCKTKEGKSRESQTNNVRPGRPRKVDQTGS